MKFVPSPTDSGSDFPKVGWEVRLLLGEPSLGWYGVGLAHTKGRGSVALHPLHT